MHRNLRIKIKKNCNKDNNCSADKSKKSATNAHGHEYAEKT